EGVGVAAVDDLGDHLEAGQPRELRRGDGLGAGRLLGALAADGGAVGEDCDPAESLALAETAAAVALVVLVAGDGGELLRGHGVLVVNPRGTTKSAGPVIGAGRWRTGVRLAVSRRRAGWPARLPRTPATTTRGRRARHSSGRRAARSRPAPAHVEHVDDRVVG